jgi:hypothetical protein
MEICNETKCRNFNEKISDHCYLYDDIKDCDKATIRSTIKSIVLIALFLFIIMIAVPAVWGILAYYFPSIDIFISKIAHWFWCLRSGC